MVVGASAAGIWILSSAVLGRRANDRVSTEESREEFWAEAERPGRGAGASSMRPSDHLRSLNPALGRLSSFFDARFPGQPKMEAEAGAALRLPSLKGLRADTARSLDGTAGGEEMAGGALFDHARLAGRWRLDRHRSDSLDGACEVMGLGALVRKAVVLVDGLSLDLGEESYELSMRSKIPWFKTSEVYPSSGEPVVHRRRDMRGGGQRGAARRTEDGLEFRVKWEEPYGGEGRDVVRLLDDGSLMVSTHMKMSGGATAGYDAYYTRVS